ncbi:hypothetical protein LINPERPRIM_LOCUS38316, partial [Linum perenne]
MLLVLSSRMAVSLAWAGGNAISQGSRFLWRGMVSAIWREICT